MGFLTGMLVVLAAIYFIEFLFSALGLLLQIILFPLMWAIGILWLFITCMFDKTDYSKTKTS